METEIIINVFIENTNIDGFSVETPKQASIDCFIKTLKPNIIKKKFVCSLKIIVQAEVNVSIDDAYRYTSASVQF